MWFRNLIFILAAGLIVTSCGDKSKGPSSSGKGSEILVVCSKSVWTGPAGDSIRKALIHNMEGLPETEPEFTLLNIQDNDFSKSLHSNRNILLIDIKNENAESKIETLKDEWSQPQRVFKISAGSDTAFFAIFRKHADAIRELYNQNERAWFCSQNEADPNTVTERTLSGEFGIQMAVSRAFQIESKRKDYLCLRSVTANGNLTLVIYTCSFKDSSQLNPASVLQLHRQLTANCIAGKQSGFKTSLEGDSLRRISQVILFKGMYALETRGFCRQEGDTLAASFLNYTIVDAPRQRIIVFDGLVDFAGKPQRNGIRQLESIIWKANFIAPDRASDQ